MTKDNERVLDLIWDTDWAAIKKFKERKDMAKHKIKTFSKKLGKAIKKAGKRKAKGKGKKKR